MYRAAEGDGRQAVRVPAVMVDGVAEQVRPFHDARQSTDRVVAGNCPDTCEVGSLTREDPETGQVAVDDQLLGRGADYHSSKPLEQALAAESLGRGRYPELVGISVVVENVAPLAGHDMMGLVDQHDRSWRELVYPPRESLHAGNLVPPSGVSYKRASSSVARRRTMTRLAVSMLTYKAAGK
jgi:hypothetical protein